ELHLLLGLENARCEIHQHLVIPVIWTKTQPPYRVTGPGPRECQISLLAPFTAGSWSSSSRL
ncbi:MAG: hypothetical protein VX135_04430, partial [Pseudomonadota bacterium]|nr:hypothetical protein [Pseudomonadota bacterium]